MKFTPEVAEKLFDYNPNAAFLIALSRSGRPIYGGFEPQSKTKELRALEYAAHDAKKAKRRRANKVARAQRKVNNRG